MYIEREQTYIYIYIYTYIYVYTYIYIYIYIYIIITGSDGVIVAVVGAGLSAFFIVGYYGP